MTVARAKVRKQPAAAVLPIPVPTQRFSHVHLDLVGPLPTSAQGYRYLFTMVDRTSRWLEAVPLKSMDAAAFAAAFATSWVARFGVPAYVTSGLAVHLYPVGAGLPAAGRPPHPHHGVPPPV